MNGPRDAMMRPAWLEAMREDAIHDGRECRAIAGDGLTKLLALIETMAGALEAVQRYEQGQLNYRAMVEVISEVLAQYDEGPDAELG